MKTKTLTLLALFFLFAPVKLVLAHNWQQLHPGLEYSEIRVTNGNRSITLHALRANPKLVALRPILSRDTQTAKQMAKKNTALAVVNANFFDTQDKPLGLIVKDGVELHPKKDISWWGVFCIKNNRASILHSSNYKTGLCDQAVQAGPRLVIQSWVPRLKEEVSRKSAIGVTRKGLVVIVVSVENIPITQLAELLKRPEYLGGLETLYALNLDGGSSSQLNIRTSTKSFNLPNFISVPVGLGIFPK